jgi:hypothetical protein
MKSQSSSAREDRPQAALGSEQESEHSRLQALQLLRHAAPSLVSRH